MNSEKKIEEMKKLRRWILNHNREWEILIGAKKGTRADYDRLIEELETNDFEELQELLFWKILQFQYKSEKWYKRAFWKLYDWLWDIRNTRRQLF
ncbi:hypothetical protein [Diplocloster hominis]|uniref:hypothetical protein n=1 Tax=Diplocloster hominis TaxID=3079010 RepID=UPI0031B9FE51